MPHQKATGAMRPAKKPRGRRAHKMRPCALCPAPCDPVPCALRPCALCPATLRPVPCALCPATLCPVPCALCPAILCAQKRPALKSSAGRFPPLVYRRADFS